MVETSVTRLPSLIAFRAFEAAGRHECFTTAAKDLEVTQGAISRQIKVLEAQIGTKLFRRVGRAVELTADGRRLHGVVVDAFERLVNGTADLRASPQSKMMIIAMDAEFSVKWFTHRMRTFIDICPDFELRTIAVPGAPFDPDADVVIAFGRGDWDDLDAEEIYREEVLPVCSPDFLNRSNGLKTPSDLQHTMILHSSPKSDWTSWLTDANCTLSGTGHGLSLPGDGPAIEAARAGLGVALGHSLLVADDLLEGRLIAPFDRTVLARNSFWLGTPRRRQPHQHYSTLRSWLLANLPESTAPGQITPPANSTLLASCPQ